MGCGDGVRHQMPLRRRFEPAVHLARPGHLQQLLFETGGLGDGGQRHQIEVLEHSSVPPGDQRRVLPIPRLRVNPRAIFGDGCGLQLIEQRQLKPIRQIPLPFQLTQKFLDDVSSDDHDNDRLQCLLGVGQHLNAPNDLRHRHWRELFQLQFDHRQGLVEIAARELGNAEKYLLGGQPGDVELAVPKRTPIPGHQS